MRHMMMDHTQMRCTNAALMDPFKHGGSFERATIHAKFEALRMAQP
jgi:hypothetical protein